MKKILAILLSLMLLLPAFAMAETAEVVTYDFGDFTMDLAATDGLQVGEKTDGQVMGILYFNYDETNTFHNNMNMVWSNTDFSPLAAMSEDELNQYANEVLLQSVNGLGAQNIAVTNGQIISVQTVPEINSLVLVLSMDADYTGAGIDLQMTLNQVQVYYPMGEKGSYIFTITADTMDAALDYMSYLDTIKVAE